MAYIGVIWGLFRFFSILKGCMGVIWDYVGLYGGYIV